MAEPFGRRLYRQRQKAGLSLRRLGAHLGVSFSTLARIERGQGLPDVHTRRLLDQWFDPSRAFPPCTCARCEKPLSPSRHEEVLARLTACETKLAVLERLWSNTYGKRGQGC